MSYVLNATGTKEIPKRKTLDERIITHSWSQQPLLEVIMHYCTGLLTP
jgi:hypothetical protein